MRAPVSRESWWKRTDFGEVALYSFTGTLTSPKLIAPDQIARAIAVVIPARAAAAQSGGRFFAADRRSGIHVG